MLFPNSYFIIHDSDKMGLLDDYNQNAGDEGAAAADSVDIRKKRSELERNIIIADADLKKLLREKQGLEIEQRKLKNEEERIRVEREALDKTLKKMNDDQRFLEEEIKGLKKKLKTLPR